MKLTDNEGDIIKTNTEGGTFNITIEGESSYSVDGGYSFGKDSLLYELTRCDAKELSIELEHFLSGGE